MKAAAVWCAGVVSVVTALSGCTDLSGQVDDFGHNGYDKRSCSDFKLLAMDAEHGAVDDKVGADRAQELVRSSAKSSDPAIRDAILAYSVAYQAGDEQAAEQASEVLMKICRF
jgi:hypothetical protein